MTISNFDPFSTMDRMLSRYGGSGSGTNRPWAVPMDVYRQGDTFVVEVDVPGTDPNSLDITVERNMLTVSGDAQASHQDADEVLVCERPHARFRRQIYLGEGLDSENIQASYDNGVLTIRISVAEQEKPRKIEVTASQGQGQQ